MGGIGLDRTAAEDGRVKVGHSTHHRDARDKAHLARHLGEQCAEDRAGRHQGRQPMRIATGTPDKTVDVVRLGTDAIVGQPGQNHGCRCSSRTAGESHAEIVDRLHQPVRPGVLRGEFTLKQK